MSIVVAYWSGTGNTKAMAEMVGKGIEQGGQEAKVLDISQVNMDELKAAKVFAMGCPAMGAEVLEEGEMESFVCDVEAFASGKIIGLFGSYGWGDGEWMRDWVERMENAGAIVIDGEGVITNDAPDADAENACITLGKALAANG